MFKLEVEKRGSDAAVVSGLLGILVGPVNVFVQPHHQRKTSIDEFEFHDLGSWIKRMRLVVFLLIFIGTGRVKIREVNSRPAGLTEEISSSEEIFDVKKREDSPRVYLEQCGIVKFQNARRGSVSVLAFLDASWPYSHRQAIMLEMLSSRLRKSGLTNILFFVVNVDPYFSRKIDTAEDDIEREAWLGVSPDEIEGFSRINKTFDFLTSSIDPDIELIQDNEELGIWKVLGGSRDQVLVIDRCGKLTYQVIVPWSILHFPYVKAAILSTYNDHPCGVCNFMGNFDLPESLSSSSTMDSVGGTVIEDSTKKTESPTIEENSQTETVTSVSIFSPSTDTTLVPDSTLPDLIDETRNSSREELRTEKNEETTAENEISTLQIDRDASTVFPEIETSGSGESSTEILGQTLNYDSTIFYQQEEIFGSEKPEIMEETMEKMADYATTNVNEAASPVTLTENPENTTTEDIFKTTENRVFENEFTTDSGLDSAEDTTNNYEATEAKDQDNAPELSSLEETTRETTESSTTPEISKENEKNEAAELYVPIRIIMHAPHFHVDVDSTRMHEYLVMKTGSSETHGHLASHDATRLYNGPQDHRETKIPDSAAEEIEQKKWPMKNLIFTKDESTGLFGEVADYWRDLSSLDNYDETEETERPGNDRIYEEEPTNGKLWEQSPKDKNENFKAVTESLRAETTSEVITEVQPITRTEEFDSEEEETRNRLIAHYSKLLPWIYYILDK